MDLSLTDDQKELLQWADSVLPKEFTLDRFNGIEGVMEETALEKLAELGWLGLALPEDNGGSGLSVVEEMLLMKEAGRYLPSPSLLATIVAAHSALENGESDLLAALVGFEKRAAIAMPAAADNELVALDAGAADLVALFETGAVSVLAMQDLTPVESASHAVDDSLSFARYARDGAPAGRHPVGSEVWTRAHILLAALLVGAGEGARDMAVEYAKIREQFGKPIGAFQAIKHKCSNMALHLTAARAQLIYAAVAFNERLADAEFRTISACALAESAATLAAFDNVQIHGGIGFTSECHAQRYVKRVTVLKLAGCVNKRYPDRLLAGPAQADLPGPA